MRMLYCATLAIHWSRAFWLHVEPEPAMRTRVAAEAVLAVLSRRARVSATASARRTGGAVALPGRGRRRRLPSCGGMGVLLPRWRGWGRGRDRSQTGDDRGRRIGRCGGRGAGPGLAGRGHAPDVALGLADPAVLLAPGELARAAAAEYPGRRERQDRQDQQHQGGAEAAGDHDGFGRL